MVNGVCRICKCEPDKHMHITYSSHTVTKQVKDSSTEKLLDEKDGVIKAKQKLLDDVDKRVQGLQDEITTITTVSSKFGIFLKQNAITPYNDALNEYLELLIRQEKDKVAAGGDRKTLDGYQNMLERYKQERKILEDSMTSNSRAQSLSTAEIKKLIESLYNLPFSGPTFQKMINIIHKTGADQNRYMEQSYTPKKSKKSTVGKWFSRKTR